MRDIIFRGKRTIDKTWIEGDLDTITDGKRYISKRARYNPDTRDWDVSEYYENNPYYVRACIEIIPETVGQYTGMNDKNGIKIFEGDIVRGLMDWGPAGMVESVVDIFFKNSVGGYRWNYFDISTIEVIGNIYDNPELLNNVPQEKVAEEYYSERQEESK
jgi:uncharacterized phage protein (TIGR01671 family)